MTVLVTGGGGFLASHLAAELRRRRPADRLSLLDRVPAPGLIACDLRDPAATVRIVSSLRPACIYHLAGTTLPQGWETLWETHVAATINVLAAAARLPAAARPRVVVIGSSAEYGRPRRALVREDSPCEPVTGYGASKLSQTLAALSFRHAAVPVVIARPFNVIGPGIPENLALGTFASQLSRIARGGQPAQLDVGNLSARRDFIDARDVARALADLGRAGVPGEAYNIASGQAVPVRRLLDELIRVSGLRVAVRMESARLRRDEVPAIAGDHRKLTDLTGWRPRIPLSRTLRDVWETCRASRDG